MPEVGSSRSPVPEDRISDSKIACVSLVTYPRTLRTTKSVHVAWSELVWKQETKSINFIPIVIPKSESS